MMSHLKKFDEMFGATLKLRNTFLEFRVSYPEIVRSASAPFLSRDTSGSTLVYDIDKNVPERKKKKENVCIGKSMTSVIVRDVPCRVDCQRMMAELKLLGFDGCYDFIGFPIKSRKGKISCRGFGFINFLNATTAARFMEQFMNYRFEDILSEKVARVELAYESRQAPYFERPNKLSKKQGYMADPEGLKAP
eukprot:TRINITY_DN7351_c0_g1_i2.p1 TRINITY_DN7351_c0_g1~~TRINITY_DN7351_c0_g1_i2.p1  ORF type:complete len:216 (-),score=41.84 TRINITY_DN7351_c0_g1_i2:234-809(-)